MEDYKLAAGDSPDEEIITNLKALLLMSQRDPSKKTIISGVYDKCKIDNFEMLMDVNPNVICCANGIIDLKKKSFRKALPSDYCFFSTNINYVEDFLKPGFADESILNEINDFFTKLFPYYSQRDYMMNHLASVFFGGAIQQSFNYYIGDGSNGKSQLIDLMSLVMGDYKGSVPLTLLTEKRAGVGGTSSEVLNLKGKRFAVLQEPSKGQTINEGVMKELTGGDVITARGLYKDAVDFKPMFSLAICANVFMNINSNDNGVWRRIKVVNFDSKFVDKDVCEEDHRYLKDKTLSSKFEVWKEYVLFMLIQKAFETQGVVNEEDYPHIMEATNRYKKSQNKVGQFIEDMIIPCTESDNKELISKNLISKTFTSWCISNYKFAIKSIDLFEELSKTYDCNAKSFVGFKLKDDLDNDTDNIIDRNSEFITAFKLKYTITDNFETHFVPRSDIQEWAKTSGLKVNTSVKINEILKNTFGRDKDDSKHCRKMRTDSSNVMMWFGIIKNE